MMTRVFPRVMSQRGKKMKRINSHQKAYERGGIEHKPLGQEIRSVRVLKGRGR